MYRDSKHEESGIHTSVLTQTLFQQLFWKISLRFFKLELTPEQEKELEEIEKNKIELELFKRFLKIPIFPFALIYFFVLEIFKKAANVTFSKSKSHTKKSGNETKKLELNYENEYIE
jgi:hypothetical protein